MAFERLRAEISLLVSQMENQPHDKHELYLQLLGFSGLTVVDRGPPGFAAFNSDEDNLFFGGEVLFDDNQVSLDALAADIQIGVSAVLLLKTRDAGSAKNTEEAPVQALHPRMLPARGRRVNLRSIPRRALPRLRRPVVTVGKKA